MCEICDHNNVKSVYIGVCYACLVSSQMVSRQESGQFSIAECCSFLSSELSKETPSSSEIIATFKSHHITGHTFLELSDIELKEIVPAVADRKRIQHIISQFNVPVMVSI